MSAFHPLRTLARGVSWANFVSPAMLNHLRKIGRFAFSTAGFLALALAFVGLISWLSGSLEPFTSAGDFWGRVVSGAVVAVAGGILCGIAADLEDRFDDWREKRRSSEP